MKYYMVYYQYRYLPYKYMPPMHKAIKASSKEEAKEKAKRQLSSQFEIIRII